MAYATKDQVENLLGRTFTIPTHYLINDNARLDIAIERAQEKIDSFTCNHWESLERVLMLTGDGTEVLSTAQVTQWSVRKIQSIYVRDAAGETFTDAVDAGTYTLSESRRHILRTGFNSSMSRRLAALTGNYLWTKSTFPNYKATCVFGTVETPITITEATVLLVRNEIEPGHVDAWLPMYAERFPDGYSYTRAADMGGASVKRPGRSPITTGHSLVDAMLSRYVTVVPFMAIGV